MTFKIREVDGLFKVTTIYAKCLAVERLELWQDLEDSAGNTNVPWMIGGDFNCILDEAEKLRGLAITQSEMVDFGQRVSACALNELKFKESIYTLRNNRVEEVSIFKRLDKVFVNNELLIIIPDNEVHHLIRQGSDHAPLHAIGDVRMEKIIKPFRFLGFWTKHSKFLKVVIEVWNEETVAGNPFQVVHVKLQRLKKFLTHWSRQTCGDFFKKD